MVAQACGAGQDISGRLVAQSADTVKGTTSATGVNIAVTGNDVLILNLITVYVNVSSQQFDIFPTQKDDKHAENNPKSGMSPVGLFKDVSEVQN